MPICPVHNVEHLPRQAGDKCWPGKHDGKHLYNVELFENSTGTTIPPFTVPLDDTANEDPDDSLQDEIADHIDNLAASKYRIRAVALRCDNTFVIYEDDSGTHNEIGRADVVYKGRNT